MPRSKRFTARSERHPERQACRQTCDRYEQSAGDHEIGRYFGATTRRGIRRMPGRRNQGTGERRQAARSGRRLKGRRRPRDADSRTVVSSHRTCRRARLGLDDEARGQSAAVGVLAGARRGLDDLQAAQSSGRPADRHPDRYVGRADRHEGPRPGHRQGAGRRAARRDRVRPQRREKGSRLRGPIRRVPPCRAAGHGQRARLL